MLGKAIRLIRKVPASWLGTLYDLLKKLTSESGSAWFEALKQFLRQELEVVSKVSDGIFSAKKTNLIIALQEAEAFHKKAFGGEIHLSKMFKLPKALPWKDVIVAFVPKGTDYRGCVTAMQKAGAGMNKPWEEVDVNNYSNSSASDLDRLFIIRRSERPDDDTMNLSLDQLVLTKKNFLGLGGYAIAMGTYHNATKSYLDPQTWTWFPNNRLASGGVSSGRWLPDDRKALFRWCSAGNAFPGIGARVAMEVPLKS